jgi:hypothetical protein
MITMENVVAFSRQLRQVGIDAEPESKHDPVMGVNVGLVVDGSFYSLAELNRPEKPPIC